MILYAAKHLLPVASPPVQSGAVAVHEGRIVAFGRRKDVVKTHADAEVRDLGDAVILPGLVNAHMHLELSWGAGEPPAGGSFATWLADFVTRRPDVTRASAEAALRTAIDAIVARGTVAVGDVANGIWSAPIVARSPLRGVLFHEVFGFRASDAESLLAEAASRLEAIDGEAAVAAARGRLISILTPHAAYSTSAALLKALGGRAVASGEILSIHVAESEDELQFLRDGTGPLKEFLVSRGGFDDGWKAPGQTPVEYLDRLGVLTPRTLAVHCVHLDHQDLTKLQARGVTVVTCPRSNQRLGVGKAPILKLLASGIPVALGTDSMATAPDVDLFNEVASLRQEHPGLAPAAALRIATLNGATALGLAKELGTVEVGKRAALAVVGLADAGDDPLEAVTWSSETVAPLDGALWEPAPR
jgi:aminodeoxyfutalosine deaminase